MKLGNNVWLFFIQFSLAWLSGQTNESWKFGFRLWLEDFHNLKLKHGRLSFTQVSPVLMRLKNILGFCYWASFGSWSSHLRSLCLSRRMEVTKHLLEKVWLRLCKRKGSIFINNDTNWNKLFLESHWWKDEFEWIYGKESMVQWCTTLCLYLLKQSISYNNRVHNND
jgi:hypothetical protein